MKASNCEPPAASGGGANCRPGNEDEALLVAVTDAAAGPRIDVENLVRGLMRIISPGYRDKYRAFISHDPSGSRPVPLCLCRQGPRHHLCLSPSCFGGADCSQFSFVIRSHFLRDKPAAHCPSLTNFESLFSMMWKRTPTPTHQLSRRV
jgi:hypothetical protein